MIPQPPLPDPTRIPAELRTRRQWVCWKYAPGDKKPRKLPLQPNGRAAKTNDPSTWSAFDDCHTAAARHGWGVGYVFSADDPFFGVDLDACIDDHGAMAPYAQRIIAMAGATLAEISPSRKGVKIIARGQPAATGRVRLRDDPEHVFECYDRERYFALTGWGVGSDAIGDASDLAAALVKATMPAPAAPPAAPQSAMLAVNHRARKWALTALDAAAREVRTAPEGARNTTLNGTAYRLGRIVAAGLLDRATAAAALRSAAQTSGLPDHEIDDVLERALTDGEQAGPPDTLPDFTASPRRAAIRAPRTGAPAGNANDKGDEEDKKLTQVEWLIRYARDHAILFHTPEGESYAAITEGVQRRTIAIGERGGGLRDWLLRAYYREHNRPPSSDALARAAETLGALARLDGETCRVWIRFAEHNGNLYLDMADAQWRVIEISATGWRILASADCPVYFRRVEGQLPLPEPVPGGSLHELRRRYPFLDDPAWGLIASFVVGLMMPPAAGAVAHLLLVGEQGSGKTMLARDLRSLVDPHEAMENAPPTKWQDFAILARNSRVLTLDNLSSIPNWMSDALCQFATGGAHAARTLYKDDKLTHLKVKAPAILTSIVDAATRGDLLDRAIVVRLPPLRAQRTERALTEEYRALHARLLGALCDAASAGLRNLPHTPVPSVRLADWLQWVEACAPALGWQAGYATAVYQAMRASSAQTALDADPLAQLLIEFVDQRKGVWQGEIHDLYEHLAEHLTANGMKSPHWFPRDAARLAGRLRRLAPELRRYGLDIEEPRQVRTEAGRKRVWSLSRTSDAATTPAPPAPSAPGASASYYVTSNGSASCDTYDRSRATSHVASQVSQVSTSVPVTPAPHQNAANTGVTGVTGNFSQSLSSCKTPPHKVITLRDGSVLKEVIPPTDGSWVDVPAGDEWVIPPGCDITLTLGGGRRIRKPPAPEPAIAGVAHRDDDDDESDSTDDDFDWDDPDLEWI